MSKTAVRRQRKKPAHAKPKKPAAPRPMTDRAVYIGLALIGAFSVALGWLLTDGLYWRELILLWLVIVAWLTIAGVAQIYRGRHIPPWQQSLARLSLRPVGFGTKEGKPLDAAHGHAPVRTALVWTIILAVIVIALAALALYRPF